jgi:hypothetical protein
VKKLVIACAALALFRSAAQAEDKINMVGDWMVRSQEDPFDKGGDATMSIGAGSFYFAVRCLEKQPSLGVVLTEDKLTAGQTFTAKLRVDRGEIIKVGGYAIEDHLIQIENDFKIWKALPGGRELAINLENGRGTSQTRVFKIFGAAEALPTVTSECPIPN